MPRVLQSPERNCTITPRPSGSPTRQPSPLLRHAITIFLSAFLLFQVQPLLGKYILPWFGGMPAVWTTCMLFFQALLLAGYAYAHASSTWLTPRWQAAVHIVLLLASLLLLPIAPADHWRPRGDEWPTGHILLLLGATVGVPYLLLSTTGPLIQAWFVRSEPGKSPYRLYALSNLGSLLALVSYPFVVEPALALPQQVWVWSGVYVLFVLACGWCAVRLALGRPAAAEALPGHKAAPSEPLPATTRPNWADVLMWLGLAAGPSAMLLAATNLMCQEIAVVPFLWVLPLSLYLLSFVICFDNESWYVRPFFCLFLAVAAGLGCAVLYYPAASDVIIPPLRFINDEAIEFCVSITMEIGAHVLAAFACAMACHGELARAKPHPRYLTAFYLTIASGGVLGGLLVAVLAPHLFVGYWEYPLALAACCGLVLLAYSRDARSLLRPTVLARWLEGMLGQTRRTLALVAGVTTTAAVWGALITAFTTLAVFIVGHITAEDEEALYRYRNFFGVLRVQEHGVGPKQERRLLNGRILHGTQYLKDPWRYEPSTYYGYNTGVGLAIDVTPQPPLNDGDPRGPLRVGIIGLGTGTIAAYASRGDLFCFYEINPEVKRVAETYFTYIQDARARGADVQIVLGDARIQLERELKENGPRQFDVLAVDAFSSDSIPMHLLTLECVRDVYFKHLKPEGILALHISNRYLDLSRVARALAEKLQLHVLRIDSDDAHLGRLQEGPEGGVSAAEWILLTHNFDFVSYSKVRQAAASWDLPSTVLWTDKHGSLWKILED